MNVVDKSPLSERSAVDLVKAMEGKNSFEFETHLLAATGKPICKNMIDATIDIYLLIIYYI